MENTFHKDLSRGLAVEEKYLAILRDKYPSASLIHKYKGYDIWIPEINKSLEIKYDPMSNKTGNIVVEIEMYGKPSGLMATTADYWVFYDDFKFVTITPNNIIRCIFDSKLIYKEFVGTGDFVPKKAFLVNKENLYNYSEK